MVIGTDISPHAVLAGREAGVPVIRTDLAAGLRRVFDLVIFNPPYLPTAPADRMDDWLEYALDGGTTGREVISRFLETAGRVLAPGGRILLLISSLTGREETLQMIHQGGWTCCLVAEEQVEGGETLIIYRLTR
jgi:release factor glutamine methyltransferase